MSPAVLSEKSLVNRKEGKLEQDMKLNENLSIRRYGGNIKMAWKHSVMTHTKV